MRALIARSTVLCLSLLALGLAGCSAKTTDTVCPDSFCGGHGACHEAASLPTCDCYDGYTGLTCGTCQAGFHRSGSSVCVADDVCASDQCGAHGTCAVTAGLASCACADGYDGLRCEGCAPGFLFIPDPASGTDGGAVTGTCILQELCTETACAPGFNCNDSSGKVVCTCSGVGCSQCTAELCGAHGSCDDNSGYAACTCETGYAGAGCAECHLGYFKTEDGTCALSARCTAQTCSGAGLCDASSGVAECDCDDGYTGDACESCADGAHRNADGRCIVNAACASDSCTANATCDDSTGDIVCVCRTGVAGQLCDYCYPGFHRDGNECVLDDQCTVTSCGDGICDDSTGVVACECPAGTLGDHCEQHTSDCGTACATGQCIALPAAFECLCTDGTWGQSCLPGPTITALSPTKGELRGGGTLTLTGTGFVSGATVSFGGVAGTNVAFYSSTTLTVTIPAALKLGAIDVKVTNPNLQVAHATYTYVPATFTYSGANQIFVVPAGVTTIYVQTWGAGGGAGNNADVLGGAGGYASAHVAVNPGDTYTLVVGQGGVRVASPTASGAGGGYSGLFLGTPGQGTAVVVAGGGGGAGYAVGENGGNGGGDFGATGPATDSSGGLGGNTAAGGIGGCLESAQCGQNGSILQGGGGGVPAAGTPRVSASFGGGGSVGVGDGFTSAGGGGGFYGGGGGSGGGGGGGGGGTGFVVATATDSTLEGSPTPGVAIHKTEIGYVTGVGAGGSSSSPTGGDGLVLLSW